MLDEGSTSCNKQSPLTSDSLIYFLTCLLGIFCGVNHVLAVWSVNVCTVRNAAVIYVILQGR